MIAKKRASAKRMLAANHITEINQNFGTRSFS